MLKPTRTELRRRQTRIRLRAVAHELMATTGVDATTIQQIADAADIGFGTFYNYFPTKDALAVEVLDCVIHNLGERNDLATRELGETDPVRIVANSIRFVMREMTTNPMWRWWLARLDLLVDRMRLGFGPFGLRDIDVAVRSGQYDIIDDDRTLAWSHLVWLMAAAGRDMTDGHLPPTREAACAQAVLRVMGVDQAAAHEATSTVLPASPDLAIDFSFEIPAVERPAVEIAVVDGGGR
jgi:AcrR family transcriptional regulator